MVLVSRAPGFALADQSEQEQRLRAWAAVLEACAHGPVRRIGWVQRTAPAQADGLARWLHEQRDPEIDHASQITQSYLELMAQSAHAVCEHEVLLCVQVDSRRLRHDDRRHAQAGADRLLRTGRRLASSARGRGPTARSPPAGSRERCGSPMTHTSTSQLAALRAAGAPTSSPNPTPGRPRPGSTGAHFRPTPRITRRLRSPAGRAPTSAPRSSRHCLEPSELVRAVAVWFEPLDPQRSLRQAEADVTREETDRRQRAAVRADRHRPPTTSPRRHPPPRTRARRRTQRSPPRRLHHRHRPQPRSS